MKYIEKYPKIIDELVKKSFPELKGKKIFIYEFNSKKFIGGAWSFLFFRTLWINRRLRKRRDILMGIITHELCHLEIDCKRGYFKSFITGLSYFFNNSVRKSEEKKAVILSIEKGFAKVNFKTAKFKEKNFKNNLKYYLSSEEIKKYAKSIAKW